MLVGLNVISWLLLRKYTYYQAGQNIDCPVTSYEIEHGCPDTYFSYNIIGLLPIINVAIIILASLAFLYYQMRGRITKKR